MSEEERKLLIKYNASQCTAAENAAVEKWLFEFNDGPIDLSAETLTSIQAQVLRQLPGQIVVARPQTQHYWRAIAAVVTLIVFGVGLFYVVYSGDLHTKPWLDRRAYSHDIAPGKSSATLTLANGRKIILSDVKNGELAKEAGVSISKTENGQLIYNVIPDANLTADVNGKAATIATGETTYNTLSTAKGETFRVRLPDGTIVFLNAASSLTYAITLNIQKERRVRLSGEAYFEVTKIKQKQEPHMLAAFVVVTNHQEVEVLGTHFNINSYGDEPVTKTTLVEGLIMVSNGELKKVLQPGQQAISKEAEGISIKPVNIQQAIAWKNGTFNFDNEDILSVMRKISRWYNVDVAFQGEVSAERFNGALSHNKNLSQVLKMLESTGVIHFKIQGRRVIVINN